MQAEQSRWIAAGRPVPILPNGQKPGRRVKRQRKKIADPIHDPLGADAPRSAGTGRVPGIDFERAHWIMKRAQRIWLGFDDDSWIAAVRQAEAEWHLAKFLGARA